jgi:plasmid stabilization system protein ParE
VARKKHRVDVTQTAQHDLASIRARISRDSRSAALTWLRDAERRVFSLGSLPLRFEVIPEASEEDFEFEYRHLIFGNYRIVYRVEETRVLVVRVIHAARLLSPEMLRDERP